MDRLRRRMPRLQEAGSSTYVVVEGAAISSLWGLCMYHRNIKLLGAFVLRKAKTKGKHIFAWVEKPRLSRKAQARTTYIDRLMAPLIHFFGWLSSFPAKISGTCTTFIGMGSFGGGRQKIAFHNTHRAHQYKKLCFDSNVSQAYSWHQKIDLMHFLVLAPTYKWGRFFAPTCIKAENVTTYQNGHGSGPRSAR